MHHDTALIALVAMGFVLARAFGYLATRVRLPPIVGYLVAGVAVDPFTPGFVGDATIASQLAEIGVILLMFGVGLHFSVDTLLSVKGIAIPGAPFALGAFFAGVLLSESELSHQAAADSLPLQDAFAVLFFVSVGMLFDPTIVVREPLAVLSVLLVIVVGKSLAAFVIVLLFRYPVATAPRVSPRSVSSHSFWPGLACRWGCCRRRGRIWVLAGALLSITLNPFVFATITPVTRWVRARPSIMSGSSAGRPVWRRCRITRGRIPRGITQ
jgi:predicted Kef-type K+ transport protein